MKNNYSRLVIIGLITIIIFLCVMTVRGYAAGNKLYFQTTIHGKVVDKEGLPIPGVAVSIKNSNNGVTTNLEGVYTIEAAPNVTLVFSFLGFKTHEEPVKGRSEINVQLFEDVTALDEVEINAGYYNTTKRQSTGNISRVTAEQIQLQPVISPLQALQGRMAGVEIISGGSNPGMAPTIRIRGRNSLREEGNYPLYIIDGVPVNSAPINSYSNLGTVGIDPLNFIDLGNIQSIEVLKDADATAIYGSRGANGVVLITSKEPRAGKISFEASLSKGVAEVPGRVELLNVDDYLKVRKKAFQNDGIEPSLLNAYDLLVWDPSKNTDWQEYFFGGSSPITDLRIAMSGGDERNQFRLTGSFFQQGTVYLGDHNYQKFTTGVQNTYTSKNGKFKTYLSLNFGQDYNNLAGYYDMSTAAFRLPPNAPQLFNENGSLNWDNWGQIGLDNPLAGFFNKSKTTSDNLNSTLNISYEIFDGLQLRSNFGYTHYSGEEIVKRPKRSYNPSTSAGNSNVSTHLFTQRDSWILEPQINYNINFGKAGVEALVGGTLQKSTNEQLGLQGEGYVSEALIGNLSAAENVNSQLDEAIDYRYSALFARLGLNWDRKYYFNLTGRKDGSSRFGPGKRVASFGAIGAAWIFSEEPLVNKNIPFLSFGKLRGSYGTTGNDQIGDYGYFDAYEPTAGPNGLYPNQLANPNYSWEINKKLEGAVDIGLLDNKINIGFSWYLNRSSNQLVGYPLPATTGFGVVQANLPATVENSGYEVDLSAVTIETSNFLWQTSLNFSLPRNKLVSFPNIEQSSYAKIYRVGHPLDISWLYEYTGLDTDSGFYSFKDVNEDGKLGIEDKTFLWNRGREFFGGFNNDLQYKNWSLAFLWQFVKQEGTLEMFNTVIPNNQRAEVIGSLTDSGPFQRISTSFAAYQAYNNAVNSSFAIVDASFARLKSLSLVYSFPNKLLNNLKLDSGKIFFQGNNLVTFTKYGGIDPEVPIGGITISSLRTFAGGLQFTF